MDVIHGGVYLYEPPISSISAQAVLVVASGHEQAGLRPWVIVSREIVNRNKRTAVGVPLSTKTDKANSYRIALPAAELIAEHSGYQFRNSVALCDHVRVLDLDLIRRKIGRVSENALLAVGLGLAFVFDIR